MLRVNKIWSRIISARYFGPSQKKVLRKVRQNMTFRHKDFFIRRPLINDQFEAKRLKFAKQTNKANLSEVIKTKNLKKIKLPGLFSLTVRKKEVQKASNVFKGFLNRDLLNYYDKEVPKLKERIYYLDHTAEVLENFRRITESEQYDKILHEERFKKACLKKEARKIQHLIPGVHQKFPLLDRFSCSEVADGTQSLRVPSLEEFTEIGAALVENQENRKKQQQQYLIETEFNRYKKNEKQLMNNRISSFLKDRTHNPELEGLFNKEQEAQKIEAHQLKLGQELQESENPEIEHNENHLALREDKTKEIADYYWDQFKLSSEIAHYQEQLVQEYKEKDIHISYGVAGKPTKFNELGESELRNYVKYDLNNMGEFDNFYQQIKEKDQYGRIASSLIQRIGNSIQKSPKLLKSLKHNPRTYKQFLKQILEKRSVLDHKNFADGIYSIGRVYQKDAEIVWNHSIKFNQRFWGDILQEAIQRVNEMSHHQLAFFCDGLSRLPRLIENIQTELSFRQAVKTKIIQEQVVMNIYCISRIMKYFASMNDIGQNEAVTRKIASWIFRQHDSPEIILPHTSVTLLRNFALEFPFYNSTKGKQGRELVSSFLQQEKKSALIPSSELTQFPTSVCIQLTMASLFKRIFPKLDEMGLDLLSEIMYCYASADVVSKKIFNSLIHSSVSAITGLEQFTPQDAGFMSWAVSKYLTQNLNSSQISGLIVPRRFMREKHIHYRIFVKLTNYMKKQKLDLHYLSLLCFSAAASGFRNPSSDFYAMAFRETVEMLEAGYQCNLKDLSAFAMSMAHLQEVNIRLLTNIINRLYLLELSLQQPTIEEVKSFCQIITSVTSLGLQQLPITDIIDTTLHFISNFLSPAFLEESLGVLFAAQFYQVPVKEQLLQAVQELIQSQYQNLSASDKIILGFQSNLLKSQEKRLKIVQNVRLFEQYLLESNKEQSEKNYGLDIRAKIKEHLVLIAKHESISIQENFYLPKAPYPILALNTDKKVALICLGDSDLIRRAGKADELTGYTKMKLREMENAGYSVKYMTQLDYVNFIEAHSNLNQIRKLLQEIMEVI